MAGHLAKKQKPVGGRTAALITALFSVLLLAAGALYIFYRVIPQVKYEKACAMFEYGRFEEAREAFTALGRYADSADMAALCTEEITMAQYDEAVSLFESGLLQEAYDAFLALGGYADSSDRAAEIEAGVILSRYEEAKALYESGDWAGAADLFGLCGDYEDSAGLLSECLEHVRLTALADSAVGDTVTFGHYEADGDSSNGPEPIEWIVLGKQNGNTFVISKYILDCVPFDSDMGPEGSSWEESTLRAWLNGEFLEGSFSDMEREMIPQVKIYAQENLTYFIVGGHDTTDRVYILSEQELDRYIDNADRACAGTAYAVSRGLFEEAGFGRWWMRLMGDRFSKAALISAAGTEDYSGTSVADESIGVRPVLWIVNGQN